ncbi:extracellular solute-binding protein [Leisingera sp. ANG-Vp]|uniref:extracellular solute-binding protein n=1 Tax=Leisingera sp. ANG-Vp TaxID=1577896 RepID=UPI0005804755|nr:extracellular solute-binding protein [Leisingera sp. ANG-Vp]KIC21137.1 spermidine/putrescine ABC transporter substrate-binding protein [Leisingera sp. ANG-Vp]
MTVKTSISRRTVLKSASAAALAAPLYTKSALASSGEINIMMWSGYMSEDFVSGFENETGIKINYTSTGSNEEMINKMKATKGQGFDLITPTNNRSLQWEPLDVLQPFDLSRVNTAAVNPAMLKVGETAWNFGGKGSHWLPHMWGTEGIAYRADKWLPEGDAPSYGDVWSEENAGKTMGRAHSMMLGAGLYMERIGEMEAGSVWAAYEDEATMRQVWGQITDWCIARKDRIKLIWNDADTQKNGLLNDGVVVGQTWDGPPLALKTAGEPVHYQAPVEGAMAWVDGLVLPAGAKNVDQAYAFIDYAYRKEIAGKEINFHGYNSPVLGADAYAGDSYKKNFAEAYPGNALANLNAWPAEAPWYADVRTEFVNKFKSA